jgi:hypothetical protein
MADGNVGSLWMSLGLKETVSKELNKIADGMTGVDAKTRKAQENLRKLADTDVSGKNISFLKKIQNALGDTSAEAKELQAVLGVIGKTKGGWKGITEDLNIGKLQQCAKLVRELEFALTNIESKKGLSDSGFNLQSTIYQSREAIDAIASLQNHLKFADAPTASGLKAIRQELQGLINEGTSLIQSPIKNYMQIDKWLNTLDGKVTDIEYKYIVATQGVSKETNAVADAGKRAEEQTKKNAEAVNVQTNALKKQEEQLKATSAAQKEKSATESKTATAPKIQPFVENKGLNKMLNEATAAREKDVAATQAQTSYQLKLNEALDAFKGKASAVIGVKDDSGRKYVDILNAANVAIEKVNKERAKAMKDQGKAFNPNDFPDPTPRLKKALEYLSLLQRIDIAQKHISEVKAANPNVDTKNIENATRLIENFRNRLLSLQDKMFGTGADNAHVLGMYGKTLAMTLKDVDAIIGKLQKPNPLSDLDGNFSKLDARIDAVREKLAKLRDLMNEGTQKGYNTSMFGERISGLGGVVARMEAAMSNKNGELANVDKMKQLFSDISVELNKASTAMQAYGREKAKAVAQEREFAVASKLSAKDKEAELKALSDYTKRYMTLVEEKRKVAEKAGISPFFKNDNGLKNIKAEIDTLLERLGRVREDIALYQHAIGTGTKEGISFGQQGLKEANTEAEKLMRSITNLQNVYDTLRVSQANVKDLIGQTPQKQRQDDIQRRMSDYYSKLEKDSAQAAKDAAKAERERAAAEKQRQNELRNTERRYDSLGNKVRQLRAEFSRGISLGAHTDKSYEEIRRLLSMMRVLRALQGSLSSTNWREHLGRLGNYGAGHDATQAERALQDQRAINAAQEKTNREKEKSIDLERKHQQEIANSAAKVRSDLVRAFEQAKNSAGGLNSTMQDFKSLIMQGGLVYGMQQFAMSVITTGGELEKQHIALQSILGDIQNANTMFSQVKELALQSPFTFSELNKDVKQLAAYGVEYDQLYDTTKRLADMASGLGVSFERIALAFGQVRSRGWLDGKELRQISYAGIPLLQKLSEYYSKREGRKVTTSDVKTRISGRGVDFEDVKNVFWEMTDAGGQFYNMQLVLSETLLGRYNKLKDAWEIMLSDFASGNSVIGKGLKGILNLVTELVQAMHSMAPVVAAAFTGFALKKMQTALGGGIGAALLSGKASMAADVQKRVLLGESVTAQELRLLQTKKQITAEDLKALVAAKALTKAELDRMLITKSITPEMYKQTLAEMGLVSKTWTLKGALSGILGPIKAIPGKIRAAAVSTASWLAGLRAGTTSVRASFAGLWASFSMRGAAAINIVTAGARTLATTLWTAIGGLPGLLITGVTMGMGYWYSKNEELKNSMKQTADELQDRYKQLNDFMKENDASKAIAEGDDRAIDNMIDEYKEKIKQIAPYNYNNLVMKAEEKESHKERLKYLADELNLLQKANELSQGRLTDSGMYKDLKDAAEKSSKVFENIDAVASDLITGGEDKQTARKKSFELSLDAKTSTENLKKEITKIFGDISNDRTALEAAKLSLSNLFSGMGIPEDRANEIRASVLQAFGITDGWLESQVGSEMRQMIDNVAPDIAMKIRSGQKLTNEEARKVRELMDDAKKNLILKYPELESTLQRLLAASHFSAVIDLVVNDAGKYGDVQGTMAKRMPKFALYEKSKKDQYMSYISSWGKQDSWYEARNAAKTEIDRLKNEYDAARKSKSSKERLNWLKYQYDNAVGAAFDLLNYDYKGEDKKSNKVPKVKGDKKDKELDELKRQLEDFKAARQAYQKLRKEAGMSRAKAKNEVFGLYKDLDWKKIDLDNYSGSIARLKGGFNFDKTIDRKKFRTQLDKENFEWRFSEELKPEWERVASNFKEALEKGVKQANLQKELYEKTGSLDFAKLAFQDGAVWDEQTRKMAEDFKKNFGYDVNLGMTEADAKVLYKDTPLALEAWQKITTLVKDNYVKSLQQAADIIAQTASTQEKIATIYAKYETPIAQAKEAGDNGLAYRYTRQRDKEVNSAKTEAFNKSSDYITFFGAVSQLGMDRASEIASQIRENINQALADGTIDAREYGKQIQQLDEQLNKLSSGKKNFFNAGLSGVAEQRVQNANEKITAGAALKQEGERLAQEATTRLLDALKNSDWDGVAKATAEVQEGKKKAKEGENKIKEGQEEAKAANKFKKAMSAVSVAADKINANIQGVVAAFNDIKDTASALGVDTESNAWQDATAFFDSLNGISNSISSIATSAMSGNVGGVIQGVVGIFTSPFKAFAAAHDAKQERQIKLAERNITELEHLRNDVKTTIENTLGGVYSYEMDKDTKATLKKVTDNYEKGLKLQKSGVLIGYNGPYTSDTYNAAKKSLAEPDNAFLAEQASLMAQKDEMQRQLNAEQGKKKKDKDKIADYKQEIKEMETTIKQLATDFLKDIYGVDMKSWASQLTDAVVSAWEKGEDAIDAYKKKARDMVKDLTKNILSQKIMEKALEGPLEALTTTIKQKGRLEPEDVLNVANELYKQTDDAVYNITAILESLKDKGLDLSATGDGSVTNGIKNITEETADILASYVNAIRLDVSVNRAQVKDIGELLKMRLPEMGQIQKAQLGQLTQIVMLAEARNEKLDRMMDWMNAVSTSGRKKLYIS